MKNLQEDLLNDKLISKPNFEQIEAVSKRKIISLYFELRIILYLGILLFTGGVGYIVYQNMSNIGHIAVMFLMLLGIGTGSYFINLKSKPYSNSEVNPDIIYFDYLLVLVSLLIISLFTYFQVYFDLVDVLIRWTSFISAILFMYAAYRYDNKMILSLGITAFAAVLGLSVSPVDWTNGQWFDGTELYILSLCFGSVLLLLGQVLDRKNVKKHFTFTFHNFGWLLFYFGALTLVLDHSEGGLMAFLLLLVVSFVSWYTWRKQSFLFFIYSCLTGYISISYLLFLLDPDWEFLIFYFPLTIIGGIVLLIKNRNHFSDDK